MYFVDVSKAMRQRTSILKIPTMEEKKVEKEEKEITTLGKKLDTFVAAQKLLYDQIVLESSRPETKN